MSGDARAVPRRPARSHGLWPREHGAYGQLGMPLVAALLLGVPSVASVALVVATLAGFLLHEPVLVLLGARGMRAKRDLGARARRRAVELALLALASGSASLMLGDHRLRLACLLPLGWLLVLTPFVLLRREKTMLGELIAAAALSAAGLPVAVSAGVHWARAALIWAVWWIALAASTVSVRSVISRGRGEPLDWGFWTVGAIVLLAAFGVTSQSWIGMGAGPMLLVNGWLVLRPPPPRHLRKVGWALMFSSVLTTGLIVALAHTVG